MHVVVCFVFLSPHFALATGFRFIVMPLLHECHCMFCFPLPPFEFANGFRFTAIPLLHELHCLFCIPLPFTCTKKLMSLSGYCVPVKCCMFLVSRITGCHEAHVQGFLDF